MKKYSKDLNSESSSGLGCTTYDLTQGLPDKANKASCNTFGIPTGVNNNNSDENLAIEPNAADDEKLGTMKCCFQSFESSYKNFLLFRCLRRITSVIFCGNQLPGDL